MKPSTCILALCLLGSNLASQTQTTVKRQYIDDKSAETTVVIKTDEGADDLAILNDQFDMDDVGMGQVIRITTEEDRAVAQVASLEVENTPEVAPAEVKAPTPTPPAASSSSTPPTLQNTATTSNNTNQSSGRATVRLAKRKKLPNPRFKKKKRRHKRRRGRASCYRF